MSLFYQCILALLMNNDLPSPKHNAARSFLRIVGPLVAVVGLIFIAIGLISFFTAFGGHGQPRYFWCGFVGMPLLFVGLVMTKFGYIGAVARYVAAESAPVAKDTINYMAEGTQGAVKTIARSVAEGVQEARRDAGPNKPPSGR